MNVRAVSFIVTLLLVPASALAQTTTSSPSAIERAVTFLAGGAAGLAIHESGHVITSLTFGANPQVLRLQSGPVPFFVIAHDPVTRRQEFVISSAGFWMQHVTSEWMLTARPNLSRESAPFLKGLLAFNVGTSVVYSVAAFARSGPPERDTRGMAVSLGRTACLNQRSARWCWRRRCSTVTGLFVRRRRGRSGRRAAPRSRRSR